MRTLLIFHLLALLKFLIKMLNRILNQMEAKNDLCDRPEDNFLNVILLFIMFLDILLQIVFCDCEINLIFS